MRRVIAAAQTPERAEQSMRTALLENPNCSETHVSFRFVGDRVDPDQITLIAGVSPAFACRKGETHVGRYTGKKAVYGTGVWYVTSEGVVESTSIERHLIFLLDLLEPKKESIKALMRQFSLSADFYIYWVSATGQGGPAISADTLQRIADLNADLNIDFLGPFDDEESEASSAEED